MASADRTVLTESDIVDAGPLREALDEAGEPVAHAGTHATGGSDPVTPASIGAAPLYPNSSGYAMPVESGSYTGHVDDATTSGVYRVASGSMSAANGYPPTPDSTGTLIVQSSHSSAYLIQTVYSNQNEAVWTRSLSVGAWRPWRRFEMAQDTGWRKVAFMASWTGVTADREHLRRIGSEVTYAGQISAFPSSTYFQAAAIIPTGFRIPSVLAAAGFPISRYPGSAPADFAASLGVNSSGTLTFKSHLSASNAVIYFTVSWLTDDSWPTALPGTPA